MTGSDPPSADVDVLVVGGRIAGATTATLLGRAGFRVLLVDRATFPSPTLSTHFFHGARLGAVLVSLGVLDEVLALGPPPLTSDYNFAGDDPVPSQDVPQNAGALGFGLSVRRGPLDDLLLRRAAQEPGVTVRVGTSVTRLVHDGARVTGAVLDAGETVNARLVVGADGRASFVAREVAAADQVREVATRAMYYRYVRGFTNPVGAEPDGAEFSLFGDELAYVFPGDAGLACVALSVDLDDFAVMRQDAERVFDEKLAAHAGLATRLAACTVESRLFGSGPKDNVVRVPAGPGWALVGDSSMHQDPWTGKGMDNAGVHATFLAEAITDWLTGRASEEAAFATYHARRDEHSLAEFQETVDLGRDLAQLSG